MRPVPPVPVAVAAGFVVAAMLVATLWPLLAYTTSLACFGFAHVVVELRYVDGRFGRRLPRALWLLTGVPLLGIVAVRGGRLVASYASDWPLRVELTLVASMVLVGAALAWRWRPPVGVFGALLGVVLLAGVVIAPIETLLVLAIGHNLTPLGFVVERAPARARWRSLALGGLVFLGAPLLVASGAAGWALADVVDVDCRFFSAADLPQHLGVYLWPAWQQTDIAVQMFSAAVCAQLLHYGAVLVWLPRALGDDDTPSLRWGGPARFAAVVVVCAIGMAVQFAVDFAGARVVYGLPAAVHAWLELPVLLAALAMPSGGVGVTSTGEPAAAQGQS